MPGSTLISYAPNFIYDVEKMYDASMLNKEDFLASYCHLSEKEYDNTTLILRKNKIRNWDDYIDFMNYINKGHLIDEFIINRANGVYD